MSDDETRSALVRDKLAYNDPAAASDYERERFSGMLGRSRDRRERRAGHCAVQQFMRDSTVLDCPCGNGRWFPRLASRAARIVGVDVAPEMVKVAQRRHIPGVEIDVRVGDAEQLDLENEAVEHVFCFALMKHIPDEAKLKVLREFARVSSGRLAVSFCLTNSISYTVWRARGARGYPTSRGALGRLCGQASLRVGAIYPVSLPVIGMEAIVVLERV